MPGEVGAAISVVKASEKVWVYYRSGAFSNVKRRRQFEQTKRLLELMHSYKQQYSTNEGFEEGSSEYLLFLKLREAINELEDVVLKVISLEEALKKTGPVRNFFHKLVLSRMDHLGVESKMQAIKTTISEIELLKGALKSGTSNTEAGSSSKPKTMQTSPPVGDHPIVGFEENTHEQFVAHLTREGYTNRFFCVLGEPGIGKSTLAGEIYELVKSKRQFEAFAWVSRPEQFEDKEVLEHILFSLGGEKTDNMKQEVEEKLSAVLKEKKCLVVLDKVWSTATILDPLKKAFLQKDSKSKLLLTTWKKNVALHVDKDCFLFKPSYLNLNYCMELIKACLGRNGTDLQSDRYSEALLTETLEECAGSQSTILPAAIIKLGQLLSGNEDTLDSKLKNLKTRVRLCLFKGKIHDLEESRHTGLSELFNRSYSALSHGDLGRSCFKLLACSFPENSELRVTEICQLLMVELLLDWMATYGKNSISVDFDEDWVYRLLEDLEQNSMVSVVKYSSTGRMKTIRLNGLMRYFGVLMAQKENLIRVLSDIQNVEEAIGSSSSGRVAKQVRHKKERRLSTTVEMDSNQWRSLIKDKSYESISSLICSKTLPAGSASKILSKRCRKLRVLKLENQRSFVKLCKKLRKLPFLMLFSLKDSNVEEVPSSIGKLKFLQTLDLRTKCALKLPYQLSKLRRLRHLYLPHKGYSVSHGKKLLLDNLQSLRKLNISMEDCDLNALAKLPPLEKLVCVRTTTGPISIPGTNSEFKCLKSVAVKNPYDEDVDISPILLSCSETLEKLRLIGIKMLPNEILLLQHLQKVTLGDSFLRDDPMRVLQNLQNLKFLILGENAFSGNEMKCSRGDFTRLQVLRLEKLEHLQSWIVEKESLPRLRRLEIVDCKKFTLRSILDALTALPSLKEILISDMPEQFRKKVEETFPHLTFLA